MKVTASAISISDSKAYKSLVVTSFSFLYVYIFLSIFIFFNLTGLMSSKVIGNTCSESLCLTMVHLKCNHLNVVNAEIKLNTGSDRF